MSSSSSPELKSNCEGTLQLDIKRSCPLPNIGNTCFLNSVIHILFRMVIIKDFLLAYNGRNQILLSLKQLFHQIIDQASIEKKTRTLLSIQKHMQPQLLDYVVGKQYDSFETLLLFLNQIQNEAPKLQKDYEVGYTLKCRCMDSPQTYNELYLENQSTKCSQCHQAFQMRLLKLPLHFIIKNKKRREIGKQLSKAFQNYNLVSKNIYRGTGNYGHYYALSKFQKFYELNDARAAEIDKRSFEEEACMFSIYERTGINRYKQKRSIQSPAQNNDQNGCNFIDWIKQNPIKSIIIFIAVVGVIILAITLIVKTQTPNSSSQSSSFETHPSLSSTQETNHLKTFFHQAKNIPSHVVNFQDTRKEKQTQSKGIRQTNLRSDDEQIKQLALGETQYKEMQEMSE